LGTHDHQAGGSNILMLPRDLEPRLAVNALPKPLRHQAAVLILESTGYVTAKPGRNPFTCWSTRSCGRSGGEFSSSAHTLCVRT
jgi:hypothetical protein